MRLLPFFATLTLLLCSTFAQAATLNFNGVDVSNCTRSGVQYTCGNLSMGDTDVIVIASGYGVTVNRSLTMTYNQGLRMSGSAALTATGNLDIKDVNPSNLKVTGGSLTAEGGTFSMGAQAQTIIANIAATTIKTGGSAVKVTGSISAKGLVEIASGSTITGSIGGNIVNILPANSQIEGDITAKTTLTVGSGSQIKGNLTAPTIDLKASGLVVTGDVTALKSLTIASGNAINGNVEGGNVTLDAANGYITGNALVDHITLGSWTHVDQTITCKAYTPANPCSCVTNNSGWPAGSVNGPKCGPGTQAAPHHFQIDHPGAALTCAPQTVTVTACADAACSAKYTGGTNVTVSPGGTATQIDSSGVATASVRQYTVGTATLSLTSVPGITGALVCKRASDASSSCDMSFAATGLTVTPVNHVSATQQAFSISAVQAAPSPTPQACVPLFKNSSKDLTLSCSYSNPASGTLPVFIKGTGGFIALAPDNSSACSILGKTINLAFDNAGVATATMSYADAGKLTLNAKYESASGSDKGLKMQGSGEVVVAPSDFVFSAIATPQRAGLAVTGVAPATVVSVAARNALKAVTPNFGRESAPPAVLLGRTVVGPTFSGHAEPSADGSLGFSGGVLIATGMGWKEVGLVQFTASLNNYLGWELPAVNGVVPPLAIGTSGQVQFIPHHFITEIVPQSDASKPQFPAACVSPLICSGGKYVYSGQPFDLRVTARNAADATTVNYDGRAQALMAPVTLQGLAPVNEKIVFPPAAPTGSRLTDGSSAQTTVNEVALDKFLLGVATQSVAYRFPGAYAMPAGAIALAPPTDVRFRASSTYASGDVVSSGPAAPKTEGELTVLTGRIMVPNSYGSERLPIRLPVQVQYWNSGWLSNASDSVTQFGNAGVTLANCSKGLTSGAGACNGLVKVQNGTYTVAGGVLPSPNGQLVLLAPGVAGSVDVSVGSLPYLPSTAGRAVFGVFKSGPVIYLRELY